MMMFDAAELLKAAEAKTGLADFGPEDFREGFFVFVEALNQDAQIAPARAGLMREWILRLLSNRAWMARDLKLHPEILEEDIGAPVFISTLPRTGSTKLHRMLAVSGDFEVLRFWQVHMPARIPGAAEGGKAERIAATRDYEKWMYEVSPGILSGHPMFTMEAEECQWLLEHTFRYPIFAGMFHVPRYLGWLVQADMLPTFEYFKMQIQYFQWQNGGKSGRPWLLKSPTHFGYEALLEKVFPGMKVVVTHRDPAKCIPSITAASLSARKLYSDAETGAVTVADLGVMFSQAAAGHMAWRDANAGAELVDVAFRDVNKDDLSAVRQVYGFLGIGLSEAAVARMRHWEANEGTEQHVKGVYSAEGFGTSEGKLREVFAGYMERFAGFI